MSRSSYQVANALATTSDGPRCEPVTARGYTQSGSPTKQPPPPERFVIPRRGQGSNRCRFYFGPSRRRLRSRSEAEGCSDGANFPPSRSARHAQRGRIEWERSAGVSCRVLAVKYGFNDQSTVWRHWHKHVTDEQKAQYLAGSNIHELAERCATEGLTVLDYLAVVRTTPLDLFQASAQAGDRHGATLTSGRLLECLREIGKITGELGKISNTGVHITNNVAVLSSPAFGHLQAAIISALAPYPDARQAVIGALHQLEAEPEPVPNLPRLEVLPKAEEAHVILNLLRSAAYDFFG
jgi:hypothetical protein